MARRCGSRRRRTAMRAGIGLVTQEFSLVGPMTVTENVMLASVGLGVVDRAGARRRVLDTAARLGVHVDPDATVESLSVGERQRVEILKALDHGCRVLILDEPTAVLVPQDVGALFDAIRRLTTDGMGVVFISHKLHEVVTIADRITVLRRGRHVATQPAAGLDPSRIAALMIGAELARAAGRRRSCRHRAAGRAPDRRVGPDDAAPPQLAALPALDVRSVVLERGGVRALDDVSIAVAPGEIVGVAGVSGNGQTELVSVLCAMSAPTSGTIHVAGGGRHRPRPGRSGARRARPDQRGSTRLRRAEPVGRAEPRARGPRPVPAVGVHPAGQGPSSTRDG